VSSSDNAEQASQIGARIIVDQLAAYAQRPDATLDGARRAMTDAIAQAHAEICAHGATARTKEPPGTTCVAALIMRERLVVGWVGDSRAYWVTDRRVELLTRDHSWVNEAVANGEATLEEALRSPYAHALTRCLGPLEPGEQHPVRPEVVTRNLASAGMLMLCSDGLWNYYPIPEQMAALIQRCGPNPTPSRLARFLVHKALSRGGQDNVAVAVYAHARK
jgi:serine/threonine protein phosphatase PrpC